MTRAVRLFCSIVGGVLARYVVVLVVKCIKGRMRP